jgi:excisionase family DNA binding protein
MQRFLTPAEAGRLLGLTAASVRRLARTGALPTAATTEGGIRLFRRAAVMVLVRRRVRLTVSRRHA